jgi:hypothetical protein
MIQKDTNLTHYKWKSSYQTSQKIKYKSILETQIYLTLLIKKMCMEN